jgi:hypothetical protein
LLTKPPVLGLALVALAVGFSAGNWHRADVTEVLREKNDFLNSQLGAYKDRLQGASPDEAAKKFSTLENHIAEQDKIFKAITVTHSRTLTAIQKDNLKNKIDRIRADIPTGLPIFSFPLGDSVFYASDIFKFFKDNNVNVLGIFQSACDINERNLLIGVKDPHHPSDSAIDFAKNLSDSGVSTAFTTWADAPQNISFDIFVCPEEISDLPAGSLLGPNR